MQNQASHDADVVILELILAAGLGLLGMIASVALSLLIGRSLVRQLRELRESALTLAHEKLPRVISQLRAGEPVDIADYAPEKAERQRGRAGPACVHVVQQTAVRPRSTRPGWARGISDVP